jgi:hypothetical protein
MVTSPLSEWPFLFVRGFRISSIQSLKPRATKELIQREWFNLGGCDFQGGSMDEIIPEALWRTLVADPGPSGTATPSQYQRAFAHCLSHRNSKGDINIDHLTVELETEPSLIIDFLKRVQSVTWD